MIITLEEFNKDTKRYLSDDAGAKVYSIKENGNVAMIAKTEDIFDNSISEKQNMAESDIRYEYIKSRAYALALPGMRHQIVH